MNTEAIVAPDVATQNPASEQVQPPEVTTPEPQAEETQPQSDETDESRAEKAAKALERRLGKRTADLYRERAAREHAERELAALKQQADPQPEKAADPVELARQIVERERLASTVTKVLSEGKKLEGFDNACNEVATVIPFYGDKGDPTAFLRVVLESDAPAKLLHHLGQNPDLVDELADLSPTQQARRLDRIERDLAAKPQVSQAPKPIKPVAATASDTDLHSGLSDADWIARREAQLRAARKRL